MSDVVDRAADPTADARIPVLEAEGIGKAYGAIQALVDVDLRIFHGDVIALVGDNGAGKSTLVKILAGEVTPTTGTLRLDGRVASFDGPAAVRQLGIETVYQDLALVDELDAASNVFLGRERRTTGPARWLGVMDQRGMRRDAHQVIRDLHISIPGIAHKPVRGMSGGQRQAVAIARATYWGRRLLLLDEPTAALGVQETAEVQRLILRLRERQLPMVVISHNLQQVFEVCTRIAVLRHGRLVADLARDEVSPEDVVAHITGAAALTGG